MLCNYRWSPQVRSRVVVVKYDRKPLSNKTLFSFTEPFGCLTEHLVLKNKVNTSAQVLLISVVVSGV